jgi:hypothetical protein
MPPNAAPTSVAAPTDLELEQARQLFADALKDEQAQRYQVAVEKFLRVQRVRDTAPVRYRIATCLEGLGRLVEAREAYRGAADQGASDESQSKLVRAAREKVAALSTRVAFLSVRLDPPRSDAEVRVDGELTSLGAVTSGEGVALDPGRHQVAATVTGFAPFQGEVSLPEGGRVTLRVPLAQQGNAMTSTETGPTPPPKDQSEHEGRPAGAWVAVGLGAAAVAGGVAALVVRELDAQSLQDACPNGICPIDRQDELIATRGRAEVLGPMGVALVVAGGVAAAVGAYFLLRPLPEKGAALQVVPVAAPGFAGITVQGASF